MNRVLFFWVVLLVTALGLPQVSFAAPPMTLSHQGRLIDDAGTPLEGVVQLEFRLFDDPVNGQPIWIEGQSADVAGGVYNVILGTTSPLNVLSFDETYYLEVVVDGEIAGRTEMTGVPYANRSTIHPNQVDEDALTFDPATQVELDALIDLVSQLQTQVSDLTAQLETAGNPFLLGTSSSTMRSGFSVNGKTGTQAATEMCRSSFPADSNAHLCSSYEIERSLAEDLFDPAAVQSMHNVETWTIAHHFDGFSTTNSAPNTCFGWGYPTGHIATGTTRTVSFNTIPLGGQVPVHYVNLRANRACAISLPVLCCR